MNVLHRIIVICTAGLLSLTGYAHGSHSQHRRDMYDVLQFEAHPQLDAWMKYVSSEMIDGYKGSPREEYGGLCFYDNLKSGFPGFACKHRLLFHWGYNAEPWTEQLAARVSKCSWSKNPDEVKRFRQALVYEQKMRNQVANALTEKTFGFAGGGKDAAFANAMISVIYDVHIIGDYTPDNSDMDGLMSFDSAVGDLIDAIRKLDAKAGNKLIKKIKKTSRIAEMKGECKATAVLELLKKDFAPFLKSAQRGSLARRFKASGYSFR